MLHPVRCNLGCVIHFLSKLSCMERFSAALNLGYSISSVKRKETNATVRIDVTLLYGYSGRIVPPSRVSQWTSGSHLDDVGSKIVNSKIWVNSK